MGKRGPKRQPGKRETNGQLSRKVEEVSKRSYNKLERDEVSTIAVGIAARERMFGIDVKHSRDQKAGSFIGRKCLQHDINQRQYDAAMLYLEQATDYRHAMQAPPEERAVNLNATRGGSGDYENVTWSQRAYSDFELAMKAVQNANAETSNRGCNLLGALQATVLRDQSLDHLLNDTRVALNVLVRHYRLADRQAA